MKKWANIVFAALAMTLLLHVLPSFAAGAMSSAEEDKNAIILASFGTTVPRAVTSIINILDRVKAAYPGTEVRLTFTSNIIRSIWRKRQADPQKWIDQGIPDEVLYAENFITTIGRLQDEGYRNIIVQPTHMFFMEQSHDLLQYVNAIASIRTTKERWRPFHKVVMGRPALGMPGDRFDYHIDVERAVETLSGDAEQARKLNAMLVYMGHGNEHWSTGIYNETQKKMRATYPETKTFIGVVEGYPGIEDFMGHLKHEGTKKIILKPFMIVAGDHAVNDMAGPEEDSWKSVLSQEGYEVEAIMEGLGSNDSFADIFVNHIKDAAIGAGIKLD